MRFRRPVFALGAGLATFVIVGVVVTELASDVIAFSLLVGLPAGLVAGLVVGAFVAVSLGDAAGPTRRRIGVGVGAFGITFLAVLLLATVGLGIRNSRALPIAGIAGLIAAWATVLNPPGDATRR